MQRHGARCLDDVYDQLYPRHQIVARKLADFFPTSYMIYTSHVMKCEATEIARSTQCGYTYLEILHDGRCSVRDLKWVKFQNTWLEFNLRIRRESFWPPNETVSKSTSLPSPFCWGAFAPHLSARRPGLLGIGPLRQVKFFAGASN